jgi:hypothetical protein
VEKPSRWWIYIQYIIFGGFFIIPRWKIVQYGRKFIKIGILVEKDVGN